jgi:hypothetical protein
MFDRFGQLIGVPATFPYYFGAKTVSGALRAIGGTVFTGTRGYRMPAPGWIVAHSCQYTVDVATSGFGAFELLLNGNPQTVGVLRVESSDGTGDDGKHAMLKRKALRFDAGDVIGAFWSESGTLELDAITGLITVVLAR